jgi:hypothetical protein
MTGLTVLGEGLLELLELGTRNISLTSQQLIPDLMEFLTKFPMVSLQVWEWHLDSGLCLPITSNTLFISLEYLPEYGDSSALSVTFAFCAEESQ